MKEEEDKVQFWKIYTSTKSSWAAMYLDCENAKESIELEQYIIENDELGRKFLLLFIKKSRAGLRVRIVCDSFGSRSLSHSPLVRQLRRAGGIFHFYQPLRWLYIFTPKCLLPRTHIKTLLIDSKITYVGGVCIAKHMEEWRDTHLRLTGPISKEVSRVLDHRKKNIPYPQAQDRDFYYLANRPLTSIHIIYKELITQIRRAKKYIYISTAFFVPNQKFIEMLQRAAGRGVEVKIIVTQHSDILLADWVAISYLGELVQKKVQVFHYNKTVMHCKIMIIDDDWATVGSTNMDILSFFYNREANVIIQEKHVIADLKAQFENDLHDVTQLTKENFHLIPLWKRCLGFLARFLKIFFTKE